MPVLTNEDTPRLMEEPGTFVGYPIRVVAMVNIKAFIDLCYLCPTPEDTATFFAVVQPLFGPPLEAAVLARFAVGGTPAPTQTPAGPGPVFLIPTPTPTPTPTLAGEALLAIPERPLVPSEDALILIDNEDQGMLVQFWGFVREPMQMESRFGVRRLLPVIEMERLQVLFTNSTWGKMRTEAVQIRTLYLQALSELAFGQPAPTEVVGDTLHKKYVEAPVVLQGRVVSFEPHSNEGFVLVEVNTETFQTTGQDTLVSIPLSGATLSQGDLVLFWGSLRPYKHEPQFGKP